MQSDKKILMIVGDYVEDYEAFVPLQMLALFKIEVHVVSPGKIDGDTIITAVHDFEGQQTYSEKKGHHMNINYKWSDIKPENYEGLVLPGGRAPEFLRLETRVMEIVKYFIENNKPIAAICHGIQLLTPTGLMKGRTLTCYPACKPEVEMCGATYKEVDDDKTVVDGNIVTCPAWPGIHEWVGNFLKLLNITHI